MYRDSKGSFHSIHSEYMLEYKFPKNRTLQMFGFDRKVQCRSLRPNIAILRGVFVPMVSLQALDPFQIMESRVDSHRQGQCLDPRGSTFAEYLLLFYL